MSERAIECILYLTPVILLVQYISDRRRRRSQPPLPPGPTPVPFLGNIIGMDQGAPYRTYAEWAKKHGDLLYTRVLNQEVIVLNSEELAIELLEKRSHIYSDRPQHGLADLLGWDKMSVLARYGPRFRLHRKLFHHALHSNAAVAYKPRQIGHAYEMLVNILHDPVDYAAHLEAFAASLVMAITYGYDATPGDQMLDKMKQAVRYFATIGTPEAAVIFGAFPLLKKLPVWMPFMGFKREAALCAKITADAVDLPYAFTRKQMHAGTARPCVVSNALEKYEIDDGSKESGVVEAIKEAAGTIYAASVETTTAILLSFIYLMTAYPDVQARAQTEIDNVVGTHRLPGFADRPALPYVDAVLREVMRWCPVVPNGFAHATSESDVYNGYYIPKGAMVIANLWAISRDETKYSNASAFLPERFLNKDGSLTGDTVLWIFGFGRRACPGRHIADASTWAAVVNILAFFRVERPANSEDVKWTTGLAYHPHPFSCSFIPRREGMYGEKLASLIALTHHDA
ncbi:hypothetical protein HYDPIDRAFT_25837 [Hydnomerulius pinastri MD-312]|nr:hypothetical protein HYDPIDRAFT_25837 [Hydnomerulius pinastri MD-312]